MDKNGFSRMEDVHEAIFARLLEYRENQGIEFVPRKRNRNGRLDRGYWFIGDDYYLLVSFWNGSDTLERIHAISFAFSIESGNCWLEMSSKDDPVRANYLEALTEKIGGFQKLGNRAKWARDFESSDVIANLDEFMEVYYPIIDQAVQSYSGKGLERISTADNEKFIDRIQRIRSDRHRIARLCWNTNMWQQPSGPDGKSTNKDTYESRNGYGFEEWLFDTATIIDGYHYGYVRAAGKGAYQGKVFSVGFYSINSQDGKKYWLGEVSKLEVITDSQREHAYQEYERRGWFDEMAIDLLDVDVKGQLKSEEVDNMFNVRYKPESLQLLDYPDNVRPELEQIKGGRYSVFLYAQKATSENNTKSADFRFQSGHSPRDETSSRVKATRTRRMQKRHNIIQRKVFEQLVEKYGKDCVGTEQNAGIGQQVDVVVDQSNDSYIFYEIKTDTRIRLNIRQAMGQLLEYVYWGTQPNVAQMIVISPVKPTADAVQYLERLRSEYGLEIYYQFYDVESDRLQYKLY